MPIRRIFRIGVNGGDDGHGARLLRGDQHVRHLVFQRLKGPDRNAKLLARLEVVQRGLIQRIDDAHRLGTQRGNGPIHRPLDDGQSPPRRTDHCIGADGDILQQQVRCACARLRGIRADAQALGIARHQEQRYAVALADLAAAARRHEESFGRSSIQHHALSARETPGAAARLRGAADESEIVSPRRLIGRERQLQGAGRNLRQKLLFQRRGRGVAQQPAASHNGAQVRLQQQPAAELFHHQHGVDGAAAEAAELLRERQRQQSQVCVLAPRLGGVAQRGRGEGAALVEIVVAGNKALQRVL